MFPLYKIINPIWYYTLSTNDSDSLHWIDYRKLTKDARNKIKLCKDYDDSIVSVFDASYQLWINGFISQNQK